MKNSLFILAFIFQLSSYAQIDFEKHVIINEDNNPIDVKSVFSVDLDGDGDLDIICNFDWYEQEHIYWYENLDGQGFYSGFKILATIGNSASILPVDIDNDSDIDIVYIRGSSLSWIENIDGLGNFSNSHSIDVGSCCFKRIFAKDLNGDNLIDIVVTNSDTNSMDWYENLGSEGSFGEAQNISTSLDDASSIYIADLDNDNLNDIVIASYVDDSISWFKNINGNFASQQVIATNLNGAISIHASDLDGDNDSDIIVASHSGDKASWFENLDGLGNFGSEQILSENLDGAIHAIAFDINQDGLKDIIVASQNDNKISWFQNNGGGIFGSEKIITSNANNIRYVDANDIDNDGFINVLSASENEINRYKYNTNETFNTKGPISFFIDYASSIELADLNGDNFLDLIYADGSLDHVSWLKNYDGTGNFCCQETIGFNLNGARDVKSGDLDNDGDNDLVVTSEFDDSVSWFENLDGLGNFGSRQIIASDRDFSGDLRIVDFNNDGYIDVVSSSSGDEKIAWYRNIEGNGTFSSEIIIDIIYTISRIETGDIDGDGGIDLVASNSTAMGNSPGNGEILWFKNTDSQGTFSSQNYITDGFGIRSLHLSDIDGDNDLDLLTTYRISGEVLWLENIDGLGNFTIEHTIDTEAVVPNSTGGYYPVNAIATDLDNDGDLDVITVGNNEKTAWYENLDGLGNFGDQQFIEYSLGAGALEGLKSTDIDNDGDMDIFTANKYRGYINWYENLTQSLSINDNSHTTFKIYPVPTKDILNINKSNILSIAIYNQIGQLIKTNSNQNSINLIELAQGIYFIKIKDDLGRTEIKKFIKN